MCARPPALTVGGMPSTAIEVHDLHKSDDGQLELRGLVAVRRSARSPLRAAATSSATWFTPADLIASRSAARRRSAAAACPARRRHSRLAGAGPVLASEPPAAQAVRHGVRRAPTATIPRFRAGQATTDRVPCRAPTGLDPVARRETWQLTERAHAQGTADKALSERRYRAVGRW